MTDNEKLAVKWRKVQHLLEQLSQEDKAASKMFNSANFDAFFHGIAWTKSMANYHLIEISKNRNKVK